MRTSAYAFASDVVDEGIDSFLDNVFGRAGLGDVTYAAVYHGGRDVFPHNPVAKVQFLEPGAWNIRPTSGLAEIRIQPTLSRYVRERDPLDELCRVAHARNAAVSAWAVFLHTDRLDLRGRGSAVNVFGDQFLADLCPANPEAREYARAIATSLAGYPIRRVVTESLHYPMLEHGFVHERYLIDLGTLSRFLLGLCFCVHCEHAAAAMGIDVEVLRTIIRLRIEQDFAGELTGSTHPLSRAEVSSIGDGQLGAYLEMRDNIVRTLIDEVRDSLGSTGPTLALIEPSGGIKGYADGLPAGPLGPTHAWRFGLDLADVARQYDELLILAYAQDPALVEAGITAYRAAVPSDVALSAVLRPTPPDCREPANLRAKVAFVEQGGLAGVDFYHYGFMRLSALDWIRHAIDPWSAGDDT